MLRVAQRPGALVELARIRGRAPGMSVLRDFTVAVQVVEENELFGDSVAIWRDVTPEEHQRWIAVALRKVAKHLIVGPVLHDDVEHVLDRRALADFGWDHTGSLDVCLRQLLIAIR